jgi:hypothetical protein
VRKQKRRLQHAGLAGAVGSDEDMDTRSKSNIHISQAAKPQDAQAIEPHRNAPISKNAGASVDGSGVAENSQRQQAGMRDRVRGAAA